MENLTQFEQELETLLPPDEADLEPNIVESMEDDFGDTITPYEDYSFEDDSDVGDSLIEMLDLESYDESFVEGNRREKSNEQRSKRNEKRGITNQKNIIRINRDVVKLKKITLTNSRNLSRHLKWARATEARNVREHKRLKIDIYRCKRAIRSVGRQTGKNSELLELMGLMAIPKLVGNVVSNQINELVVTENVAGPDGSILEVERTFQVVDQQNDLLSSLAPSIPDLTALVGRYTKANKFVLVGVALLMTALFGNKAIQRSSN